MLQAIAAAWAIIFPFFLHLHSSETESQGKRGFWLELFISSESGHRAKKERAKYLFIGARRVSSSPKFRKSIKHTGLSHIF